ncbi:uncharacterized protein LOC143217957 [Lasioglossum baleicum]|uniref:uncharacterized protein LOC143217957 n=1 Tax=Lasioglossum baleicum TaxID=434251 RepID=UPI003FCCAB79
MWPKQEEENVSSQDDNIEIDIPVDKPGPSNPKKRRGQKAFITDKLVATLDKCKVSDRDAVRIITATAQALNHDVDDLIINRTSIRHQRTNIRKKLAEKYRVAFKNCELGAVTLHWDGKLLPALESKEKIDRLPILITCSGIEQLLGIPALLSGSGKDQASAVHNLVEEWDLGEKVQALCCDTTSSNMGRFQGTCVLLENLFERQLIYFPCRHHIYEIILRSAYDEKLEKSSGPNVPIFKHFQAVWPQINKANFIAGIEDEYVHQSINNLTEVLEFAMQTLKSEKQPVEDYREFIELVIIFLGGKCAENYVFRAPGAFHHARWMAKAIYCLKIYLFRKEFTLTSKEVTGIRDICIFLANLYLKAWIRAPFAIEAPRQDLEFLQNLYAYHQNEIISCTALKKLINHLWYLAPETAALSCFDSAVPHETKIHMVEAMNASAENDGKDSIKKFTICPDDVHKYRDKKINHFISPHSKRLFEKFLIPTSFLGKDPCTWNNDPDFKIGMNIVQGLKVVNDIAERGVKLMEDYNQLLSRNEEEKQYILQTVMEYRKQYPDATKQSLLKDF